MVEPSEKYGKAAGKGYSYRFWKKNTIPPYDSVFLDWQKQLGFHQLKRGGGQNPTAFVRLQSGTLLLETLAGVHCRTRLQRSQSHCARCGASVKVRFFFFFFFSGLSCMFFLWDVLACFF